jgi:trans-2,3-dihydro-3-hydroxyanthranilate isomerase
VEKIPVSLRENGSGLFGEMLQPEPAFGEEHPLELFAKLVGLKPQDLVNEIPIQTVSTGQPKIIVPIRTLSAIRRVKLDFAAIESYCQTTDKAAGLYLVTMETEDPSARIHARNILSWTEDPVTGSGTQVGAIVQCARKQGFS